MTETRKAKSTGRQRAISSIRLAEIIDICKEKGVAKLTLDGVATIELFPFAVNMGAVPSIDKSPSVENGDGLGHNSDETDMDLLLHSAR